MPARLNIIRTPRPSGDQVRDRDIGVVTTSAAIPVTNRNPTSAERAKNVADTVAVRRGMTSKSCSGLSTGQPSFVYNAVKIVTSLNRRK
jgi:hypothetical protein